MSEKLIEDLQKVITLFEKYNKMDSREFTLKKRELEDEIENKYKKSMIDYVFYKSLLESFCRTINKLQNE